MAIFYDGPYILAGGGISKERIIGTLDTVSKDVVKDTAKKLSKGQGRGGGITVTATIPEKRYTVMASGGRIVAIPKILKDRNRRAERAEADDVEIEEEESDEETD